LNALILGNKECPSRLSGRRISIAVLDLDSEGPSFGRRALSALLAEKAPLYGLDVTFEYIKYDWSGACQLRAGLGEIGEIGAGICSSEGGLFDYGSDQDIVANLSVLRDSTPPDFMVVGSVVRDVASLDTRLQVTTVSQGRPLIRYLGLDAFRTLVQQAGWSIDGVIDSVAHHSVRLKKML
jgi:hypothetical protein